MKKTFKFNKLILFIAIIYNTISFSQETFKFKDISRHSFYTIKIEEAPLLDNNSEHSKYIQNEKMYKLLDAFIIYNEKLAKQIDELELLHNEEQKKELKFKKNESRNNFRAIFDFLKWKDKSTSHYRDIDLYSSSLLKKTKLERERFKTRIANYKIIKGSKQNSKLPKDKANLKFLRAANISSEIKGKYTVAGKVYIATKNSANDNIYENQVLDKVVNNDYNIYQHFKSVDGSGVDFYNSTIDVYNEYMVKREPKKRTKKEIDIIRKVKLYLKQADPYLKKMYNGILARKNFTLTKNKRAIWANATKQVKVIDKKIRALYSNNYDSYYDFQKLLDTKTIEDKTYFNDVLNNSKQMLGLY